MFKLNWKPPTSRPHCYFRSDADKSASRIALHARVSPEIKALASTSSSPYPKSLTVVNHSSLLQTHDAFLRIRTLEDTQDQSAKKARNEVEMGQSVLDAALPTRAPCTTKQTEGASGSLHTPPVRPNQASATSPPWIDIEQLHIPRGSQT